MIEFEVSCRMGREPRLDDIRMAAAEALHLRPNAVINVIDPTKSYQPTMVNADAHCHIVHRSIDARVTSRCATEWRHTRKMSRMRNINFLSIRMFIMLNLSL